MNLSRKLGFFFETLHRGCSVIKARSVPSLNVTLDRSSLAATGAGAGGGGSPQLGILLDQLLVEGGQGLALV